MSVWFEGQSEIKCDIEQVKRALENLGDHFVGVVSLMQGLTSVELLDQGPEHVTIKTNEGVMKRTGISRSVHAGKATIEFDEEYQAGSVTTKSHFLEEFESTDGVVVFHVVIRDVTAPGFLGFFYRKLGSSATGNAVLNSHKSYFEST